MSISKKELVRSAHEKAYIDGKVPTRLPENKPIYKALLARAASYPSSEPWKARAYEKAAASVASCSRNLYTLYWGGGWGWTIHLVSDPIPFIGLSIEEFISTLVNKSDDLKRLPTLHCTVPENQPIYDAILKKAATYSLNKHYKYKAYREAALSVLRYKKNIYNDCMNINTFYDINHLDGYIKEFIYNFIQSRSSESLVNTTEPTH